MGVLNKLMFWKKEDEFDFDRVAKKEMQNAGIPHEDFNVETKSPWEEKSVFDAEDHPPITAPPLGQKFPPQPSPYQQQTVPMAGTANRDWDLINSKLDTLRAMLQSIEQRLVVLERGTEEKPRQRLW
ncbi:MAG: hypothetical protein AABX37_02625 [Nanoarchaeota archaeon]